MILFHQAAVKRYGNRFSTSTEYKKGESSVFSLFYNLQNDKLLGRIGQINAAVLNDVQHILNTHAEPARQVNTRLCGDNTACRQRRFSARRGNRSLVDLQSYTMAEAVAEGITVACRLDNLTACRVNVPALQAAMPASCAFSTVSYTVCISSVT